MSGPAAEHLWSPWRMAYIESAHEADAGCIFCDKPRVSDDELVWILARGQHAFVLLNAFPYNPGHLMVAPYRHLSEITGLEPGEMAEMSALLQRSVRVIRDVTDPDGFNLGMNLGRVAGAGIPGHLHWHVVPRWNGDTNFISIVGETRVLPELLAETYAKLKPAF